MKTSKLILGAIMAAIGIIGISAVLPVQTRPQPTSASPASNLVTQCPPDTAKGTYFERGHDKDGNVICGFAYYNPCPYYEGAEAGTPECEKGKPTPEQLEPWNPEPETEVKPTNQCGGK